MSWDAAWEVRICGVRMPAFAHALAAAKVVDGSIVIALRYMLSMCCKLHRHIETRSQASTAELQLTESTRSCENISPISDAATSQRADRRHALTTAPTVIASGDSPLLL